MAGAAKEAAKPEALNSRKLQAQRTKERIYQSALRLIEEVGYANASVAGITQAAGVSTGSFYTYFSSKEDILLHTFVKSSEIYQKAYSSVTGLPFPENLYHFIQLSYFGLDQRGKEVMYGVVTNSLAPDFKAAISDQSRGFYQFIRLLIQQGLDEKKLSPLHDSDTYVQLLFTILTGVEFTWCVNDYQENLSVKAENAVKALMHGFVSESAK